MDNSNDVVEELLNINELCEIIKLKKSYLYLLTHEKRIPHYKINGHLRFRLSDIEEWLKNQFVDVKDQMKIVDY